MFERIREDVMCVFERDPAARNVFEVMTTYPGVLAIAFHRMNHALWCRNFKWLARILSNVARLFSGIEIHPGAKIGRRFFIDHGMGVVIGETAEIGDDCTLYHGVTLGGTNPSDDVGKSHKRHPTLGNNVVVGAGAKVLGPITVSDGARIGSNAVVVKDVPKDTTMVGVLAREVKPRNQDAETQRREQVAKKLGFDAYGASKDMPDPIAHAMNRLLDHIHLMDERMDTMCGEMNRLGAKVDDNPLPKLESEDLNTCLEAKKTNSSTR